jgi:hypothetical protein
MEITNVKTMTGLSMAEAAAKLDEQLPAEAYTAVPGGADLTDIDPNYMRKVLNEVFGLCGFGWGYEYDPADMEIHNETRKTQSSTREVVVAALKHLRFWYKVTDGAETSVCTVDASGGSDNSNASYAMKGAITNALGNAASNIGFQESVYLGHRSHKTVKAQKPAPAPISSPHGKAPAAQKAAAPAPAVTRPAPAAKQLAPAKVRPMSAPAPAPALAAGAAGADDEIEEIEPPAELTVDDFIIPLGQRKGQKLADQQLTTIQWYADQMTTGGDAQKEALKKAAQAILAVRSNGHKPQSTAA